MTTPVSIVSNPQLPMGQRDSSLLFPSLKNLSGDGDLLHEYWTAERDGRSKDRSGWWRSAGARNHLFADSSVRLVEVADILRAHDGLPNPNVTIDGIRGRDVE